MKKNLKKFLSLACVGFLLTGCGSSNQSSNETADISKPLADESAVAAGNFTQNDAISGDFGTQMNLFAFDLYEQLNTGDNLFFSPYSILSALSVLENAAGTTTKDELDTLLYIGSRDERNSDMKLFAESFTDDKAVLNTANSLWVSVDLNVKDDAEESFFAPVKYYYDADVFQADFSDAQTLTGVNNWISDNTEGMIPNMLDSLDPDTAMLIVNAVYFKGQWTNSFSEGDTIPQIFYGTNGETEVDMMHQFKTDYAYTEADGMMGIRLPYGDGDIAMDVWISSDPTKNIGDLFSSLSSKEKCELFAKLDSASTIEINHLALPKFSVDGETVSLNDALSALGMEESFRDGLADFNTVNDTLYVSKICHQAKIEVDESGTTAAAGTTIAVDTMSLAPTYNFVADRPFVYAIRDCKTGAILFLGIMNNM